MTFGIESSNIVGYTTKEAEKGMFKIFSAPFESVTGSMKLNDLIASGIPGTDYDEEDAFKDTAAQIQIPSEAGYDVYYYLNDGWYMDGEKEAYKPGWCDSYGVLVDAEITPGVAYWFKSVPSDATPTVAGAVNSDDSSTVSCPAGFALRANPFPLPVAVNGSKMTSADIVGVDYDESETFKDTAPQIQIPSEAGYDVYYYLNDGWYMDGEKEAYKPGWCDSYGVLVDAEIPVMQGIWTKGVTGTFTLTFTK